MLGLDEAGCGPAAGNLVAAAVHLADDAAVSGLRDSKKMSERARERCCDQLVASCRFGVGQVTSEEINAIGLGEARRVVFERALDDFASKYPDFAIASLVVDGTIFRPWRSVPYRCEEKADDAYPCVSAASVIAKVTRDRDVARLCDEHPELDERYDLRRNKGYLTLAHRRGLKTHGFSAHHRRYKVKLPDDDD